MVAQRLLRQWRGAICLLLIAAAVTATALYKLQYVHNVPRGDVIYDVVVARNLVHGRGFTTNLMPLGALQAATERGLGAQDPWPSLHKFLFQQAALAPLVRVLGDSITTAQIASLLAYGALVATMFALFARVLGSTWYAFGYALAFVTFDELNSLALTGVNGCTDTLLFFLAMLAWLGTLQRPKLAPLAGVAIALCVLDRYSFTLVLPFYIGGVLLGSGRTAALKVGAGAAAVLLPVVGWSWLKYGLPWPSPQGQQLLLFRTRYMATDPWFLSSWPRVSDTTGDLSSELWRKVVANSQLMRDMLFYRPGDVVRNTALVVAAALGAWPYVRKRGPHRWMIVAMVLFATVFASVHLLLVVAYRYVAFVLPWLWVLACLFIHERAKRLRNARIPSSLLASGAVAALIGPEIVGMRRAEIWCRANAKACARDEYCNRDEINAFIRDHFPRQGLVISAGNKPWELALETNNRVIAAPERPEEIPRLRSRGVPLDLLLLPADLHEAGDDLPPRTWLIWDAVRNSRLNAFDGLTLRHVFSDGSLLYARDAGSPAALDYCSLPGNVDVRRETDRAFLGRTFRYTERNGDNAWSWVIGPKAKLAIVGCKGATQLSLDLVTASEPLEVGVRVNDRELNAVQLATPMAWSEHVVPVPPGALVDGVNEIELEVRNSHAPETALQIGFARATLESK